MYLTTAGVRAARAAGVRTQPVLLEPDAWIELPDGGWDAWLATLPRKRRTKVRHEIRAFEEAGYQISHARLVDCHERLAPVASAMARKYGYRARTEDFATELKMYAEVTGETGMVALCTHGADLIGFCIYYVWQDTIVLRWASFDHDRLTGSEEYFNLAYYSQIRLAGDVGARWLHAGKNTLAAKVYRGARLRPLWLLDLSDASVLTDHADEIRRHNAGILADLDADPRTATAVADRDDWEPFC
jgi:hypothetical protein